MTNLSVEQPSERALAWCLEVVGEVGQPCRVTRLRGGLAASTHLIEIGVDATAIAERLSGFVEQALRRAAFPA